MDRDSPSQALRIRLPYGTEEEFIERFGTNVARSGVFIPTRSLKPEGTPLQFEFILADGTRLLRGEGMVLKTQVDEGGGRSGMTVRFTRLDAASKAVVDRVLAARGGAPPPAPDAPAPVTSAPVGPPAAAPTPDASAPAAPSAMADEPPAVERRSRPIPVPEMPRRLSATSDDLVLGIDFGTTFARCAAVIDGVPQLLPVSLPALVAFDGDGFVVGGAAKAQLLSDPGRAVFAPKRLLGRRARSAQLREWAARLPYDVAADLEGDVAVELGGTVHSVPDIVSRVLSALKTAAEEHLGRGIRRAILCAPAYFNHRQRSALLRAGHLAGLEVVRMFNEPSAVALAYGHGRGLARKRVLVYDLGGGTFDASVVQITGNDLEVVASGGDAFLGGMDFDERVAAALRRTLGGAEDPHALLRLRDAAEQAKIVLSDVERTLVQLPGSSPPTELTRSAVEQLTSDLTNRTVETTQAVLEAARLAPGSLDEVLIVGGQSLAPLVRRRMEEALGRQARADVDPLAAVALGAAILGDAMVRAEKGRAGVRLSEMLSLPIGIALRDGSMRRVLDRRTPLPAEKTLSIPLSGGAPVTIAVFQGDSAAAADNEYLGSLRLSSERGGEAALRFRINADGTLQVGARAPGAREEAEFDSGDGGDSIRAEIQRSAPFAEEAPTPPAAAGLLGGIRRLFGRR